MPVPVLATALFARFGSRGEDDFANRLLSAMRLEFGGHVERPGEAGTTAKSMSWRCSTAAADALVLFGATGDLAHKKIFPALQALVQQGALNVPVVGVARSGWNLERLKAAHARQPRAGHGALDRRGLRAARKLLRYVDGDYREPATFKLLRETLGGFRSSAALSRVAAEPVRDGCGQSARVRLRGRRARGRREAVRPRPGVGARA